MKGPKTGVIKARLRSLNDKAYQLLPQSHCVVLISVGQRVHEGEMFAATIDFVNNYAAKCTIVVADILQRHNLQVQHQLDSQAALQESAKEGELWCRRNCQIIKELRIPWDLFHWKTWLIQPDYYKFRMQIDFLYQNNKLFQKEFENTINDFLSRRRKKGEVILDVMAWRDACLEYLKEECTIMMPMWREEGFNYILYPREEPAAIDITRRIFVQPYSPHHLQWLALQFKRYAQSEPYAFKTTFDSQKMDCEGKISDVTLINVKAKCVCNQRQ